MRIPFIAAAVLSIACADASGQAYRWVDKEGKVHYTQTPPPPDAKAVQKKTFRHGPVETSNLPYATQLADQARALLVKRAVPFKEVGVVTQKDVDEIKGLSGKTDVPLLTVGAQVQTGFQESLYNGLLDSAGYPSSVPQVPIEALRKMEPAAKSPAPAQAQQGAGAPPGSYSAYR
ncbi:MAG: DUF4124 domain-containing protein [Betaproteobacteria bacterium]|nr:MAG: DUF4124 domain-containing protein [Betaproteobacteria bacterium]